MLTLSKTIYAKKQPTNVVPILELEITEFIRKNPLYDFDKIISVTDNEDMSKTYLLSFILIKTES